MSHSMRLLRSAGIVANRRDGRVIYYRLDDDHVARMLELSRAHGAHDATDAHDTADISADDRPTP